MVFAKPEELVALGVPILDVDLQDGKIVRILEHSPEDMRQRIEAEAKLLSFKAMAHPTKKKATQAKAKPKEETPVPKPKEAAPAEVDPEEGDPEFISRLKGIRDQFTGTKVEFEDLVLLPAIFRMVRQISKAEFQKALRVVSRKGVPKKDIKKFRLFLETKGEVGYRLGQALRAYVSADTKPKISKLAKQYDQSLLDIKLAIIGLRKFHAR
jgi:hypothetical protein